MLIPPFRARFGLVIALIAVAAATALQAAADTPPMLPRHVLVAPVASAMQVDGLAVEAYAIASSMDAPSTADAIVRHWSHASPASAVVRTQAGDWLVLGRGEPTGHETVQLRTTPAGTEGYFSRRRAARATPSLPPPLRLPRGSRTLLSVGSATGTAHSQQTVLRVRSPPGAAAAELLANARRAGWREVLPTAAAAVASGRERSHAVRLVRDADELVIATVPLTNGTGIVLQHLRAVPR